MVAQRVPPVTTTPGEDAAELAAHVHDRLRQQIALKVKEIDARDRTIELLRINARRTAIEEAGFRAIHRHALGITCEFPACDQRLTVTTNNPTSETGIGAPHVNGLVGAASAMRWRIGPNTAGELGMLGERVWSTGIADLCPTHNGATAADLDRKPT